MVPTSQVVYNMPPYDPNLSRVPGPPYPYPVVISQSKMPRDYVVWSFINSSFMNIAFLGFIALAFSIKSRDCKVVGDIEGAARYGRIAKQVNIAALIVGIFFLIAMITVMATTGKFILEQALARMSNEHQHHV